MITQFLPFLMANRIWAIHTEVTRGKGLRSVKRRLFSRLFGVLRTRCFDLLFLVGLLQHRDFINVKRAIIQLAGNAYVMPFVPLQSVLIVNIDDALIFL
jgi:hypothetical protein